MKTRLLLPLLLALCACSPPPPPPPPPPPAAVGPDPSLAGARSGTWVRAEGRRNDEAIIWAYREDYTPDAARPKLLTVSQGVVAATASGFSMRHQQQPGLEQREKRLREGLRGKAELVAVLDWSQQHDWYFYAVPELSSEEVTRLLEAGKFTDIRTTLEDDAGFVFYRTLRQRVGGSPQ